MEPLRREFERDLALLAETSRDSLELMKRRTLSPLGFDYDQFYTGGVLYLLDVAKRAGREHVPDVAVMLSFGRGALALSRSYSTSLKGDLGAVIEHDLFLVRTMNTINRLLLRLERQPAASYAELIRMLDEALPETRVPFGGVVAMVRDHTAEVAESRGKPEELAAAQKDVAVLLAHFQLVLGVMLKWNIVAEDAYRRNPGAVTLQELRSGYVKPILGALEPLGRVLQRFTRGGAG